MGKVEKGLPTDRNLTELFEAAGLSRSILCARGLTDLRVHSLTDDSRLAKRGVCFFAVPGSRVDGRSFIDDAVRRGASAVVSDDAGTVPLPVGAVAVRDVASALARLAAAFYGFTPGQPHTHMHVVGVTGTNGKTTTTMLLQSILNAAGHTTALFGTIRYDLAGEIIDAPWTTPPAVELYRNLARAAERGATHAVMEVSSHALAQSRCLGHRYAAAVFTNLTGDHLDYHGTFHAYADAKKKLFDHLDPHAHAVVNADDPMSQYMIHRCRAKPVTFGLHGRPDVTAEIFDERIDGTDFRLILPGGSCPVRLRLTGRHAVANALAAAAAAHAMSIRLDAIRDGLESLPAVPGRLQRIAAPHRDVSVFVDYAHTDDALVKVLGALRPLTPGRLICAFGCGGDRDRSKRPRMARAVARAADLAIATSDNPRTEDPGAIIADICTGFEPRQRCLVEVEPDRRAAIKRAIEFARDGDTVLIAGKGHENYQIVGTTRRHFDDAETAAEFLNTKADTAP